MNLHFFNVCAFVRCVLKLLLLFFRRTNVQPIEEAHIISKAFLKLNLRPAQGSYKKKIVFRSVCSQVDLGHVYKNLISYPDHIARSTQCE